MQHDPVLVLVKPRFALRRKVVAGAIVEDEEQLATRPTLDQLLQEIEERVPLRTGTPPAAAVSDNPAVQKQLAIAVARAYRWQALLDQGRYESMNDLADAASLDRAYVRRLLNLTLLSPDLVRAILDGTEPDGLSLAQLMEGVPERWEEQGHGHSTA